MSTLHPLPLTRSVLDPIHGLVRLTEQEVEVLNHKVYQRLRKIKQNGLLHLVFPSATHTRFEHSIGVLFVADSMLRALVFNSGTAEEKERLQGPQVPNDDGHAVDFNAAAGTVLPELFRVVRLAALVHDLGHGPLSHTFDDFAPGVENILNLLSNPELKALRNADGIFRAYAQKHAKKGATLIRTPHEVMSCVFFALIWSEVKPDDLETPRRIAAAILGQEAFELVSAEFRPWISLVHDLVASAPADADRMDYLERDSRSCGVSYGLFDRNRLLKTMLCYRSRTGGLEHYRLGLKLSGYRAVENFVQARFELFVQVYYHKTNRAIASMLDAISRRASERQLTVLSADTLERLVEEYVTIGDDYFLDALRGCASAHPIRDNEVNTIASDIHDRHLWKRVFDLQEAGGIPLIEGPAVFNGLRSEAGDTELFEDTLEAKATKDLDKGAAILRQDSNGFYVAARDLKWEQVSPVIKALGEGEKSLYRIYVRSTDKTRAKEIRAAARKVVSELREGKSK